ISLLEWRSRIFHYAIKEPRARQDEQDAERLRRSRRTQGLPPEFGFYEKPKRAATSKTDMTDEKQDAQTILMTPTRFWLNQESLQFSEENQEYEKVSLYNRWDGTMQLVNAYFFFRWYREKMVREQ
ncbi:hypothetical protein TNCT_179811, partial [Trichonephila clavata]